MVIGVRGVRRRGRGAGGQRGAHRRSTEPGSTGWVDARPEEGGSDRSALRPPTSWYLRWPKAAALPSARLRPGSPSDRLCQPQVKRARPPRPAGGASEGGALLGRATATQLDPSCYGAPACPRQRYMSTGPPPWESSPGWKWPPSHSHMDRLACQHGGAAGKSAHIGGGPKPTAQTAATRCRRARRLRAGGVRGQHTRGRPSMRHRANLRHGPPPGARSPPSLSTPPRRAPGERGCFA